LARLEALAQDNRKALRALEEGLRTEREAREALKAEILAEVPQPPSEVRREHPPERPDLALRVAVVAIDVTAPSRSKPEGPRGPGP